MTIGIGIVTYNRLDLVKEAVAAVLKYTTGPYCLVVADDGSTDGTRDFLINEKITVIGDQNRGIAWNKNRALYTLRNYTDANPIIILEDDTLPMKYGWQEEWRRVVSKYGYATHAHPKVMDAVLGGQGTPDDPYGCTKITSQCSAVSREALDTVGYFDTRFRGYGVEDGEWTTRLRNSGFGIVGIKTDGPALKANCMIVGGVSTLPAVSFRDNDSVRRNRELFERIRNDPIPRLAWRDDEEKAVLLNDIEDALRAVPIVGRSADGVMVIQRRKQAEEAKPAVPRTRGGDVRAGQVVYLHIADATTGVSTIQAALAQNRQYLFENGIVYPDVHSDSAIRQGNVTPDNGHLLDGILQPPAVVQARKARAKDSLQQMLENSASRSFLYSSESFSQCSVDRLVEFVDFVRGNGAEVKIIYYVRHLMDVALSLYSRSLKEGATSGDFAKFLQQYRSDYANVIANLSAAVGKENMIVRLYDEERSSLISNFFGMFVGDSQQAAKLLREVSDERSSETLAPDHTSVMQFANSLLSGMDKTLARQISKEIAARLNDRPQTHEERTVVTREEVEILEANSADVLSYVNEFVRDRFQLRVMSDRISVGQRSQAWTERDEAFKAVLEVVVARLKDQLSSAKAAAQVRRKAELLYRTGVSAEREGRFEEAAELFGQAARMDTNHARAKARYDQLQQQLVRQ